MMHNEVHTTREEAVVSLPGLAARPNIRSRDEAEGASDEKVFLIDGETGSDRWLSDRGCSSWMFPSGSASVPVSDRSSRSPKMSSESWPREPDEIYPRIQGGGPGCVSPQQLVEYVVGWVEDNPTREAVTRHLSRCVDCWIEANAMKEAMDHIFGPPPPEVETRRAERLAVLSQAPPGTT